MKSLEKLEVKKCKLASVKGGTTNSLLEAGYSENEYEDLNGNGKLDKYDMENQEPIVFVPVPKN